MVYKYLYETHRTVQIRKANSGIDMILNKFRYINENNFKNLCTVWFVAISSSLPIYFICVLVVFSAGTISMILASLGKNGGILRKYYSFSLYENVRD